MGQVWTFDGAPATTMGAPSGLVTLLEGTTFCICETSGDLRPGGAMTFTWDASARRLADLIESVPISAPQRDIVARGERAF